jgi:hypothetical protein
LLVQAMRRAVNTTCQGSAADVVKGAMVQLAAQLRASGLGRHCRMLLQVSHVHPAVGFMPGWTVLLLWMCARTCLLPEHSAQTGPPSTRLLPLPLLLCLLWLQVHDELLFEVAQPHLQQVASLVRGVMEGAGQAWGLSVALPVKLAVGPSWGQLQDYREGADAGGSGHDSATGTAAAGGAGATTAQES